MHFITGFPKLLGKDCIFVVVDRLTKFSHLFFITRKFTGAQLAELLFRVVFRFHGLPKTIVRDRDRKFFSAFWKELFKKVGTNLNTNTSYHPQYDGQIERVNQWLE